MAILWFFHSYAFVLFLKNQKRAITFLYGLKTKNKATLYHETLKVEEKKVLLFIHLETLWRIYSQFVIFWGLRPYH